MPTMRNVIFIIYSLLLSVSAFSMMPTANNSLSYTPMMEVQTSCNVREYTGFSAETFNDFQTNSGYVLEG